MRARVLMLVLSLALGGLRQLQPLASSLNGCQVCDLCLDGHGMRHCWNLLRE